MNTQPRGIYLLIATQMWERFSFYGMRTLLVLFMVQSMRMGAAEAIGIYALFTTLVNLGGLIGGLLADRIWGLRRAVYIGGSLIGLGHVCLSLGTLSVSFFVGLGLIVVGSSLFGVNVKALVGQLYGEGDPRREPGYMLFYAGINLGGFLAAVSCGLAAQWYGWPVGFGLAGIGMFIGLFVLFIYRHLLEGRGEPPAGISHSERGLCLSALVFSLFLIVLLIKSHAIFLPFLPVIGLCVMGGGLYGLRGHEARGKILLIGGLILPYMGFFIVEDLMGSSLMLFSQHRVDRSIAGWEIPSSALIAVNPFLIVALGPLMAILMERGGVRIDKASVIKMNSMAFLLLGLAFGVLCWGVQVSGDDRVPIAYVVVGFSLMAIGELFVAPTLYAYCSASAPPAWKGRMMGLVVVGRSYASLFSGMLGKTVTLFEGEMMEFAGISVAAFALCVILLMVGFVFKKNIDKKQLYC